MYEIDLSASMLFREIQRIRPKRNGRGRDRFSPEDRAYFIALKRMYYNQLKGKVPEWLLR